MRHALLPTLIGCLALSPSCGDSKTPAYLTAIADEAPGDNCDYGGVEVAVGADNDFDGVLDADEVTSTTYVCDGADGVSALTNVAVEPAGANCEAGGLLIETGTDTDGDGALAATEVSNRSYVCNGVDGADGVGYVSRVTSESPGTNCAGGGLLIETGPDIDGNGILAPDEVADISYLCNGVDGVSQLSVVTGESAGGNCASGGVRIDSGADADNSGALDPDEVTDTSFVCDGSNGADGIAPLVATTIEGPGVNCPLGGLRIQTGPDTDGSGALDPGEVADTSYLCDSGNGQIATAFTETNVNANTGAPITIQQATIEVPAAGQVLAIADMDAFCYAPALGDGYDCAAGTPAADGCVSISDVPDGDPCPGQGQPQSYFWLNQNTTNSLSRSRLFAAPAAGSYTYYLRATNDWKQPGEVGFWRRQLVLIYLPTP